MVFLGFIWTELAAVLYFCRSRRPRGSFPLSNGRGSGEGFAPSSGGLTPAIFSRREKEGSALGRERRLHQLDPIAHAVRQDLVVKVVSGVMQHRAVPVADEDECSGPRLEHEGEVLRAHGRWGVRLDMGVACDLARNARREVGLGGMIDGRGIAPTVVDARRRAGCRGEGAGDCVDSLFDQVAGCGFQRPDRAVEPGRLRDDVVGGASPELRDRDDARVQGSTLRDAMVCKAITICAPTTTGSMP